MTCLGKTLAVAIPDTILEERDTPRDKTVKLGLVARACAIYGVDVVQVFSEGRRRGEPTLIRKVLEYLETPQYLRRRIFPLDESLRYAGLLPPLRIPSHKAKVPVERLEVGEFREGVTNADGTVEVGLDKAPLLEKRTAADKRVTVRVTSKSPFTAQIVDRRSVNDYWGFAVESATLEEVFTDGRFRLKVATSRYGNALRSQIERLQQAVRTSPGTKLVFGPPSRGLFDLMGPELSKKADFVLNLFTEQHVQTVRTEEALFAGLSLISTLIA